MKKLKLRKEILAIIFVLVIIGIVGITYAFLGSDGIFSNTFNTPTYDVQIEENFEGKFGKKEVHFVNRGETPVVIRVSYNELWKKEIESNTFVTLSNKINGLDTVTKNWTNEWLTNFKPSKDGWYYYNKILNANDTIQVLNSINLNTSAIIKDLNYEKYYEYDYELDFNFEAIQATEKSIKEIWNYEVAIDNTGNITWPM